MISTQSTTQTVKHLDHLNLSVQDLAHSLEWYQRVFGFEIVEQGVQEDGTPWAIVRSGEALLCLYHKPGHAPFERAAPRHQLRHFALRITDWAAWLETVEREQVPANCGTGEIRYPHSRSFYVSDPTGYQIEVVCWDEDTLRF